MRESFAQKIVHVLHDYIFNKSTYKNSIYQYSIFAIFASSLKFSRNLVLVLYNIKEDFTLNLSVYNIASY